MAGSLQPHLQAQSRLLALPRELRDMVYAYYTTTKDGYRLNPRTHRLALVDGTPIDLSLLHTCKLVATEMQGLHLRLNTVHFWTNCVGDTNITSQSFDNDLSYYFGVLCAILGDARDFIDDDIVRYVEKAHPVCLPHILQLRAVRQYNNYELSSWGATPSLHRKFVHETIGQILRGPNYAGIRDLIHREELTVKDVKYLATKAHPAWQIDKRAYLEHPLFAKNGDEKAQRLSAAATAISFMESLPCKTKKNLRSIVLHEDKKTDAWPECHTQGLISFCQENPNLHIERHVSIWGNILAASSGDFVPNNDLTSYKAYSSQITKRGFAPWIAETLALPSLGMPQGSFKLVLDGNPCPDLATEIFAVTQRDATWQMLFEQHNMDNSSPQSESWSQIRGNWTYITKGFPGAIRDIVEGRSIIKCNFPTRSGLDANGNHISESGQGIEFDASWSSVQWEIHWDSHSAKGYEVRTLESGALDVQRISHN